MSPNKIKEELIKQYSVFHFPCAQYIQISYPYCSNGYTCKNKANCVLWQLFYPIDFPDEQQKFKSYGKQSIIQSDNVIQLNLFY